MSTRTLLRRAIARRTRQPFFRRMNATEGTATGGGTTTLDDSTLLLQPNNFWNNSLVYLPATDVVREISAYTLANNRLTWIELTAAVGAGDKYESWSTFSPIEVHDAINQGLRDAWPNLFTVDVQDLVVREHVGVTHDLSGLSPLPKRVAQVWLESLGPSSVTGVSTGVGLAQNRLEDTERTFTAADVGKEIRIYGGTSVGDRRTISAFVDANTVDVSANFSSTLDATSKYRMVDVVHAYSYFSSILNWDVDQYDHPANLYVSTQLSTYEGWLLRLVCESEYEVLAKEDSVTECPDEYVELAALSRLYLTALHGRPESELDEWIALQRTYSEAAETYAKRHRMQHMHGQITDVSVARGRPSYYPF